jgi:hypothetical protein
LCGDALKAQRSAIYHGRLLIADKTPMRSAVRVKVSVVGVKVLVCAIFRKKYRKFFRKTIDNTSI